MRIALQNPVAQVIVAILRGRGPSGTPRQGVMMLIGYAQVSTQDQPLQLQHDALTDGGCEKLFREKPSGIRTTLPAREKLLAFARKGDVVVMWKPDRLGRSLRDLIDVVNSLQDRGLGLTVPPGSHRHDNTRRQTHVSHLCRTRRVRARHDP